MNITEDLESAFDLTLEESIRVNSTEIGIHYDIPSIIGIIAACFGVICDIFIVCTIAKNMRMKTRRNIILMNWAFFDALDFPIFSEAIAGLITLIFPDVNDNFDVCLISFSSALFKFNCIFLIILLVSTTIARMQFLTDTKFKWILYTVSLLIYACNLFLCLYVSYMLIFAKFTFMFLILIVVVIVKEINVCFKACKDDPISEKTKVKMNLVRIFTYNYTAVVILAFFFSAMADDMNSFLFVIIEHLDVSLHLTPFYMLIYLYHADENFKNALKNLFKCCCKERVDSNLDAAVVYNEGNNRDGVDFIRI